ncbi:MAG: class I SAM-dependent methyltransferase, partial [Ilumatobacteraceae bacterium]
MELAEYRRMAEVEDTHWWYRSVRALLQELLAMDLPSGGRFLDVGAGTGATGAWLADRGELVAVDFEPLALTLHRERHPSSEVVSCDARTLPFADSSFDAVIEVTMLCHRSIENPVDVVKEMARVVKPGGMVCIWEPGVRRLWRAHDRETHTGRRFSRGDVAAMVTASGLELERSTGAFSFLIPPAAAKTVFERGGSSSDLDRNESGLGGALSVAAAGERRLLRRVDLP